MSQFKPIDQFSPLPCPFCGSKNLDFYEAPHEEGNCGYGVEVNCECGACGGGELDEEAAIKKWNTRTFTAHDRQS